MRLRGRGRSMLSRAKGAEQENLKEEQPWGSDSPARLQSPRTQTRVSNKLYDFSPFSFYTFEGSNGVMINRESG